MVTHFSHNAFNEAFNHLYDEYKVEDDNVIARYRSYLEEEGDFHDFKVYITVLHTYLLLGFVSLISKRLYAQIDSTRTINC